MSIHKISIWSVLLRENVVNNVISIIFVRCFMFAPNQYGGRSAGIPAGLNLAKYIQERLPTNFPRNKSIQIIILWINIQILSLRNQF